eukprot:scaffold36006_cov168-Amphora_coffeaeformis.AAC.3
MVANILAQHETKLSDTLQQFRHELPWNVTQTLADASRILISLKKYGIGLEPSSLDEGREKVDQ